MSFVVVVVTLMRAMVFLRIVESFIVFALVA